MCSSIRFKRNIGIRNFRLFWNIRYFRNKRSFRFFRI
jgi:hypothetical protein